MESQKSMLDSTIEWPMDGDPVIRWQTMRDPADRHEDEWLALHRAARSGLHTA